MKKIYWVETDRFDTKPNKSPWLEMARGLRKRGYEVNLLTGFRRDRYQPEEASDAITYFRSLQGSFTFRLSLMFNIATWLIRTVSRNAIIILSPAGLLCAPYLRMFGLRNLHLDVRTLPVTYDRSFKGRLDRLLFWRFTMRHLARLARSRSFITSRLKKSVEERLHMVYDDSVIWQSGVSLQKFRMVARVADTGAGETFTVFYHGSIYPTRGVDTLIRAMKHVSPDLRRRVRLVVIGPEAGYLRLNTLVAEHGLSGQVDIRGYVPYEQIPAEIAAADCCVCPLPDLPEWNVSSPLKVFEYMACAKPIVLTPIPAHRDVAAELDFVVWADGYRAEDLAAAIDRCYRDIENLRARALTGPRIVASKYEWDIQAGLLAEYLSAKYERRH